LRTHSWVNCWRIIAFFLFFLVLFAPVSPIAAADDPVVIFPDTNLEIVVRNAIHKSTDDIHQSNLKSLFSLLGDDKNISNLTGLEHCTSLTVAFLSNNQITDISPLASLTNLKSLWLENNQVSDVSPIASLINLNDLYLENNLIENISSLVTLTNLYTLYLDNNLIIDISPLSCLNNLVKISLKNNKINDISPLVANSGLTDATEVFIYDNPLNVDSINVHIPQLYGRGIYVGYDLPIITTATVTPTNTDRSAEFRVDRYLFQEKVRKAEAEGAITNKIQKFINENQILFNIVVVAICIPIFLLVLGAIMRALKKRR